MQRLRTRVLYVAMFDESTLSTPLEKVAQIYLRKSPVYCKEQFSPLNQEDRSLMMQS